MQPDNDLTRRVIRCAIEVHRTLGPGLLESVYEACLCHELDLASTTLLRQVRLPIVYKGHRIDTNLIIDVLAEQSLVLEIKTWAAIIRTWHATSLTSRRC